MISNVPTGVNLDYYLERTTNSNYAILFNDKRYELLQSDMQELYIDFTNLDNTDDKPIRLVWTGGYDNEADVDCTEDYWHIDSSDWDKEEALDILVGLVKDATEITIVTE